MRYVFEDIEAEKVSSEIQRRGVRPRQRVRVVLETLDEDISLALLAEKGGAFDFLADEPDLYSSADLKS
jgi:hypothetical protein